MRTLPATIFISSSPMCTLTLRPMALICRFISLIQRQTPKLRRYPLSSTMKDDCFNSPHTSEQPWTTWDGRFGRSRTLEERSNRWSPSLFRGQFIAHSDLQDSRSPRSFDEAADDTTDFVFGLH